MSRVVEREVEHQAQRKERLEYEWPSRLSWYEEVEWDNLKRREWDYNTITSQLDAHLLLCDVSKID